MELEQVFDNLTFKPIHALGKKIQSTVDFFCATVFDTYNGKQILTMIVRMKLLQQFCLVYSDTNDRYIV